MDNIKFGAKDFVHLHLHSDYSLLQSAIQLKPLANRLNELEMKACALTDYGNMYGAVSFYAAMKYAGIRPIVGIDVHVTLGSRFDRTTSVKPGERPFYNLVLLATDFTGYQNLVHLTSKAFTEGLHHKPKIDIDLLMERSAGLIALSGGSDGLVGHFIRSGEIEAARAQAGKLNEIFGVGNFYLEVQDHGIDEQRSTRSSILELSKKLDVPVVATNDVHYLSEDDARAHEVLLCIGDGRTLSESGRYTYQTSKYYLRSADEMWQTFGGELPHALTNTLEIAERCRLELPIGEQNLTLPSYPIPPDSGCVTIDEYFEQVTLDGFEQRSESVLNKMRVDGTLKYDLDAYHARLQTEIGIIKDMGFPGYFLIVWDFIKYAVEKGIPVGPGRGSAAGSLVAYCLGITGIDPLQYDLLFERFLNPERVSMPDIDIDFCIRGRGDVINHVTEVYGRDSVCQIITFGTMASKAAIKDVGRALNMPYGEVEKIAKLMPPPVRGRNISISQALEQVPELKAAVANDPKVKDLIDLALRIEGCSRHSSVHAAGVVISPRPLHEIVPVALSAKSELTSQYSMTDLEKVGMLKMDFLALTTLTVIADCLETLKEKEGIEIDWNSIPLNDEATMDLFGDGRTDAVFQFESSGMQDICRRLKPKELEDLSALNALYRPGPIDGGMIEDFIQRHRGDKPVRYLVPEMKDILSNTYGVLVYQEQIMQLAQRLAGYSLGDADMMRRAMGKKKREDMAIHEEKFVSGSVKNGIKKEKAEEIFNLMAQFADYGFNRSHSIAYAYLAFQTAYLKAHYPAHFYASVLSHESDDSAKVYKYSNELRSMGLRLLPPDVNESGEGFTPAGDSVRFGLNAIKGIGSSSVRAMIDARDDGRFTSLFDFVARIDQGAIGRRGLESLITAGAFDTLRPEDCSTNSWRARLFAGIDPALAYSQRAWSDKQRGQSGLFGFESESDVASEASLPDAEAWSQAEMSRQEKAAVGFYLSVHPLDSYIETITNLKILNIADYPEINPGDILKIAGIVSGAQVKYSKKGNRFCVFRLEDQSTGVKCLAWAEAYSKFSESLKNDKLLIVEGRVEAIDGQEITMIVSDVRDLIEAVPKSARAVSIRVPAERCDEAYFSSLFEILNQTQGRCDVYLNLALKDLDVKIQSTPLRIQGSSRLQSDLEARGCGVEWVI
ncbi:MAG TPA: DNA polymerase III subunit alpha [Pyrinomonadaceae bacterium]|nr:DNA polymerase III subunit alpha [Pyrinomonadaceae bacterium]